MTAPMRILIASDGSPSALAALDTAQRFPWPEGSQVRGIVVLEGLGWTTEPMFRESTVAALRAVANDTRKRLAERWPDADVIQRRGDTVRAICHEQDRFQADVIALGWRGHGSFARLLVGSISRSVAERAGCSVLIVRESAKKARAARRFLLGYDGSGNSRRAIEFLSRLEAPPANRAVIVHIVEPLYSPSLTRVTANIRAQIREAIAQEMRERLRQHGKEMQRLADRLRAAGWNVVTRTRTGAPLKMLLAEAARTRSEILIVGARGTRGLRRMLLGSVAYGAMNQSPIPVVIAR